MYRRKISKGPLLRGSKSGKPITRKGKPIYKRIVEKGAYLRCKRVSEEGGYLELPKSELLQYAKQKDIKNRWKMTKKELAKALEKADRTLTDW